MKTLLLLLLMGSFMGLRSQSIEDICPLKVSDTIPASGLKNGKCEEVVLTDYTSDKRTVVVFYRGGWCPYCMRHLSALGEIKTEMDSLGYELIAISPDDFTKLDSSIVRSGDLGYTLLSDVNAEAMQDFGLAWKISDSLYHKYKDKYQLDLEWWSGNTEHLLPVPAVFVVKNGIIQYAHVDPNYRQRLDAKVLLAMLENN